MKRSIAAVALLLVLLLCFSSPARAGLDTFDSGAGNWQAYLMNNDGYSWGTDPTYNPTGGNPGGYISTAAISAGPNSRLYCIELASSSSSTLFGDLTGQTITFDMKLSGTVTTLAGTTPPVAHLYIGTDSSDYYVATTGVALNTKWTTYKVAISSANFIEWPGLKGTQSFAAVAANYLHIGLFFTSGDYSATMNGLNRQGLISANGATVSIDNFGIYTPSAVPLPSALWILGPGLASLALVRKSFRLLASRLRVQ